MDVDATWMRSVDLVNIDNNTVRDSSYWILRTIKGALWLPLAVNVNISEWCLNLCIILNHITIYGLIYFDQEGIIYCFIAFYSNNDSKFPQYPGKNNIANFKATVLPSVRHIALLF